MRKGRRCYPHRRWQDVTLLSAENAVEKSDLLADMMAHKRRSKDTAWGLSSGTCYKQVYRITLGRETKHTRFGSLPASVASVNLQKYGYLLMILRRLHQDRQTYFFGIVVWYLVLGKVGLCVCVCVLAFHRACLLEINRLWGEYLRNIWSLKGISAEYFFLWDIWSAEYFFLQGENLRNIWP